MGLIQDLKLSRRPLAGFAAIGFSWAVFFAQMPVIKADVGASDGVYGVVVLVAAFGALAAMWLAPLSQRLAGGMALPLGIAGVAVGMLGAGIAGGIVTLTLAMLLAAMGSGVTDVLVNARVAEIEARSGRSLMNLNHALYSFAYAGAALMTGVLRNAGLAPVAIFAGLAVVLVFLAVATRDVTPDLEDEADIAAAVLPQRLVWMAGGVVLIAFLAEASAEGWSALHLERTLGGTPAQGALGPAMLGLCMGTGRLFGHALAQFMRDTVLMTLATLVAACGLLVAGLAGSVGLALAGFALTGLGISVVAPLALAFVGRNVPPAARLAAISRASVLGYAAFFFGPPLIGLIAEGFGLRASFVVVAFVLALTALILPPALGRRSAC